MRRKSFSSIVCPMVGSITVLVIGLSASAKTTHPRLTQVTWTTDIAPIIQRRCVGCHVDGGFAPMPLVRYEDARNWSRSIAEHAMEGSMPPWPAAPGVGDFTNDRSLTPIEVELLESWAEGGAAEGPVASTLTRSRAATRAANLLLDLSPSATGVSRVTRYTLATAIDQERWITGWEFQPSQPSRVERAVLGVAADGRIASWLPPEGAVTFPDGVARRLPPRSTLTVDVYYRKAATPAAEGGRVGLYFGAAPRHQLRHRSLGCGTTIVDEAIDVLALEPTASEAGAAIEAQARRPDLSIEPLILIRRFLTWYVPTYRYRSAVRLPRGTRVEVRSTSGDCGLSLDYVPAR
jgi:hypothetical protein